MSTLHRAEPSIRFLTQLVQEIAMGELLIPRFQRDNSWRVDQRIELLRSVRESIPMGSILTWPATNYRLSVKRSFGQRAVPEAANASYILDGAQRLTTLFVALMAPEPSELRYVYDLDKDDFDAVPNDGLSATQLPLERLLDSVGLLRFQRRLQGPNVDEWVAKLDELARAFREYKVPVIPIETNELDKAIRTFSRVNTQGTQMGELDMLHALTWTPDFELRDAFEAARQEILLPLGWESFSDDALLKVSKTVLGLDPYTKDSDAVSQALKSAPETVDEAAQAVARAAQLLASWGVASADVLPYELQALVLAHVLYRRPALDDAQRSCLEGWFWLSSAGELFQGMSGYRLVRTLQDVQAMLDDGRWRWSGARTYRAATLSSRFDFRAARTRTLFLIVARFRKNAANDGWSRLLASHAKDALSPVFTREQVIRSHRVGLANRFIVAPDQLGDFKAR
ncbi:MAG: DUF262 domain-containing protein, partial [Myxococcota bacterium]